MKHGSRQINADQAEEQATYPVLCAWCEKEGRETVVNWISVPGSHGICPAHRAQLLREAKEFRLREQ